MDFAKELKEKTAYIDGRLTAMLPEETGRMALCTEAMNYSFTAGGKRLRPIFMAETYKLFGGCGDEIYRFALSLELIHTYSLVHDDLPAMDNDMYRRGKLTTHAKYGEAMGILAGDGLLTLAYEEGTKAAMECGDPSRGLRGIRILASKAGIAGMLGGQVIDVQNEDNKDIDIDTIREIHKLKTAGLIEAAMMCGATVAGASDEEISIVERIAENVGIAFQIQDDILDIIGDEAELGKPVGSDAANGKVTYATLLGVDEASKEVKRLSDEANKLLAGLGRDSEFLEALIASLIYRRA